jgi:hypothetical protein
VPDPLAASVHRMANGERDAQAMGSHKVLEAITTALSPICLLLLFDMTESLSSKFKKKEKKKKKKKISSGTLL